MYFAVKNIVNVDYLNIDFNPFKVFDRPQGGVCALSRYNLKEEEEDPCGSCRSSCVCVTVL